MAAALRHVAGAARAGRHRVRGAARAVLRPARRPISPSSCRRWSRPACWPRPRARAAGSGWPGRLSEITLLQIVEAVDGASPPYECREIRQQGRGALPAEECQSTCVLAEKMAEAHEAWRHSLATTSLADIIAALPPSIPPRTRLRLTGTP